MGAIAGYDIPPDSYWLDEDDRARLEELENARLLAEE